jgi:hypothetical protein
MPLTLVCACIGIHVDTLANGAKPIQRLVNESKQPSVRESKASIS